MASLCQVLHFGLSISYALFLGFEFLSCFHFIRKLVLLENVDLGYNGLRPRILSPLSYGLACKKILLYMSWKLISISVVIRISPYLEHWVKLGK